MIRQYLPDKTIRGRGVDGTILDNATKNKNIPCNVLRLYTIASQKT